MLRLLIRIFVRDPENTADPGVRRAYGGVCGGLGIALNVLLSGLKLASGLLSGSIAVVADGFNNLSDAASSVITVIGFRLSGKEDDAEHPFGHGRMEYISGLIVSMIILLMGFELAKTSLDRILHPAPVAFDIMSAAVLALSILVKLYMHLYNRKVSDLIGSPAMKAAAADAVSDVVATAAVLISGILGRFTGLNADGWTGLIVSLLIFRAGCCAARDTIGPLLGNSPSPEFVSRIEEIVLSYEQISGVHDLIVHDYGPGRTIVSLHAEVPADGCLIELHDLIDAAERRLKTELGAEAVIHMDPVYTQDERISRIRDGIAAAICEQVDPRITIHDFRLSAGGSRTNAIFDAVLPYGLNRPDADVMAGICGAVRCLDAALVPIVTLEHSYVPEKRG